MPVLHVANSLDDDVGVRLEQADQLLAGEHRLSAQDRPLALDKDALDQRQIVAELGTPALDRDPGEVGQPFSGLLHRRLGSVGGGDQLAIELAPWRRPYSIARARFLARRRRSHHCSAGARGNAAAGAAAAS
jgi:hypothetical protein